MTKVVIEQDYDDQGRIIREIVTRDGELVQRSTFDYHDGTLVEIPILKVVPNE